MIRHRSNDTAARAAKFCSFLMLGTLVSACYLRVDTRVGKRIYPFPDNAALDDVSAGDELTPVSASSQPLPPLSVCWPEFEAPDPAGMLRSDGSLTLPPQRAAEVETRAVQAAFVEALRRHRVDARPVTHACRHGFVQNGDTDYYVRPTILYVEKHHRRQSVSQSRKRGFAPHASPTDPPASEDAVSMNSQEKTFRYQSIYVIALEISIYRQGGELVFLSRQAGAARLNQKFTSGKLLAISIDRLVADLRAGRLAEVLQ